MVVLPVPFSEAETLSLLNVQLRRSGKQAFQIQIPHYIIDVLSKRLKELLSCGTKISQQLQHGHGSIIVKVISVNEVDALALSQVETMKPLKFHCINYIHLPVIIPHVYAQVRSFSILLLKHFSLFRKADSIMLHFLIIRNL